MMEVQHVVLTLLSSLEHFVGHVLVPQAQDIVGAFGFVRGYLGDVLKAANERCQIGCFDPRTVDVRASGPKKCHVVTLFTHTFRDGDGDVTGGIRQIDGMWRGLIAPCHSRNSHTRNSIG
jgi:hypothetical protein